MSTATLREKLTFDDQHRRTLHVRMAMNCRDAAKRHPDISRPLRAKMRIHALHARGRMT